MKNKKKDKLIKNLFSKLWPINRSITGPGLFKSLRIIKKEVKLLKIKKIKSGTKVFDWVIPKVWNVSEAWIKDEKGKKILDFKKNNLHLMGYSSPVNRLVTYKKMNKHLFSLKKQPNAIPYVTSYYKKNWGFCIKDNERKKINKKKKYHVFINSKFSKGSMNYGEVFLKGRSKKEILFSTYLCHPSLANNELSGPILATLIYKWLVKKKRYYSYRIIFIPETIGSIAYLNKNLQNLKKNIIAGFVLSCVGDEKSYSYMPSRNGNTLSDLQIKNVFKKNKIKYKKFSWLDRGSDERQYCAPGVDLPVASLMRSKYGTYKEYHTSLDTFENVLTEKGLRETFKLYKEIIENIEKNLYPSALNKCEPFMTKYKLYKTVSIKNSYLKKGNLLLNLLTYSDGTISAKDIARKIKINYNEVLKQIAFLKKIKLLEL